MKNPGEKFNIYNINNMSIQKKQLSTSEEYTNFVREFVTLLDKQFIVWEDWSKNKEV